MNELSQIIILLIGIILVYFTYQTIRLLLDRSDYLESDYYKKTQTKFLKMRMDAGLYGEYLCSKHLNKMEGNKRFLYNVYLEKKNKNNDTTEVDVIMIHNSGIYVLESKNYSGWIFGSEEDRNWTQRLKNGIKNRFYNPIKQNRTHIKYLLKTLSEIGDFTDITRSIIVFSERCELKKLTINSEEIKVIKRNKLLATCKQIAEENPNKLTDEQIEEIYTLLESHCNVSDEVKQEHIEKIKSKNYK